jgi:hypothetical protein
MGASMPPEASMKANRIESDNFPPPAMIRVPFSGPTICPFNLKDTKSKSKKMFLPIF